MGFFIRFAEVLVRCLCFHFFTYVVHAVSEKHLKPASWAVTKFNHLPGILPLLHFFLLGIPLIGPEPRLCRIQHAVSQLKGSGQLRNDSRSL